MKAFPGLIAAIALLVALHPLMAQSDLNIVGVRPLTEEIKPWPEYEVGGNGFNSLDMSSRLKGSSYPFVHLFGHDSISPCGPVQFQHSIHPIFGTTSRRNDGILVDGNDHDDPQEFLGAVIQSPTETKGFGFAVSGGGH